MDPIKSTEPDTTVDPYTGQLKPIELQQNSMVYQPLNRNLLYTKAEIDAMFAAEDASDDSLYVEKAGDTMTGALTIGVNNASLYLGDTTNASSYTSYNGRAYFGYDAVGNAVVQGGGSKGIEFNVNTASFGSGTAMTLDTSGLLGIGVTPTASNGYLQLPASTTLATGGIAWGTDTNLYRSAADTLRTSDSMIIDTNLQVSGIAAVGRPALAGYQFYSQPSGNNVGIIAASNDSNYSGSYIEARPITSTVVGNLLRLSLNNGSDQVMVVNGTGQVLLPGSTTSTRSLIFGGDTNLYRSASNTLATDDAFQVLGASTYSAGNITIGPGTTSVGLSVRASSFNGFTFDIYSDSASAYSFFRRSRGSFASPTVVTNGSFMGSIGFRGYADAGMPVQDAARISGYATQDFSTTHGGAIAFYTAANGTAVGSGASQRMTIYSDGNVGIGVTVPTFKLQLAAATTAAGGIGFGTDVSLYRSAADVLNTDDKLVVALELEVDGNLNHDGTNVGLYGVAPVARATTGIAEAAFVENAGGVAVNDDSTFGGYTIRQVVQALQNIGILT